MLPWIFVRLHLPGSPDGWHTAHEPASTLPFCGVPTWHAEQLVCAGCACKSGSKWQVRHEPVWPGGMEVVAGVLEVSELVVGPAVVVVTKHEE